MEEFVAYKGLRKHIYKLPTQIVLTTTTAFEGQYIPEDQIARLALDNNGIVYLHYIHSTKKTQYGQYPNLVLKTQVFTRHELIEPLCEIEYQNLQIQERAKSKAFILNISKSLANVIQYYKQRESLLFSRNHLNETDIKKQTLQQFELLSQIIKLRKNTFDISRTQKRIPFSDIVVLCYLKSIVKNIPNSYPDYLLRTSYSHLLIWYLSNQKKLVEQVKQQKQKGEEKFKQQSIPNPFVNELDSYLNVNTKRFGISILIATAIYALFVQ